MYTVHENKLDANTEFIQLVKQLTTTINLLQWGQQKYPTRFKSVIYFLFFRGVRLQQDVYTSTIDKRSMYK